MNDDNHKLTTGCSIKVFRTDVEPQRNNMHAELIGVPLSVRQHNDVLGVARRAMDPRGHLICHYLEQNLLSSDNISM